MTNIRKLYLYLRYYLHLPDRKGDSNPIICIIDNRLKHPGLVDRFKTIITAYFISKHNNKPFKILFSIPFNLSDYLAPNEYDWSCTQDDLQFSLISSRILTYPRFKLSQLDPSIEYHVYDGGDYFPHLFASWVMTINDGGKNEYTELWGELFHELFKPSEFLHKELVSVGKPEDSYIAVHFRFLNLLGGFEVVKQPITLNNEERVSLVEKCLGTIQKIRKETKMPVMVFSDSNTFQDKVALEEGVLIIDGKIEHVSFLKDENSAMKIFLDFFLLSKAKKVYSIIYPGMYRSAFPAFAAWSNKKSFYRMEFDEKDECTISKIIR